MSTEAAEFEISGEVTSAEVDRHAIGDGSADRTADAEAVIDDAAIVLLRLYSPRQSNREQVEGSCSAEQSLQSTGFNAAESVPQQHSSRPRREP